MSFYAVRNGRVPGIYTNWDQCESQVKGFKNNRYKKFRSYEEALDFLSPDYDSLQWLPYRQQNYDSCYESSNHNVSRIHGIFVIALLLALGWFCYTKNLFTSI